MATCRICGAPLSQGQPDKCPRCGAAQEQRAPATPEPPPLQTEEKPRAARAGMYPLVPPPGARSTRVSEEAGRVHADRVTAAPEPFGPAESAVVHPLSTGTPAWRSLNHDAQQTRCAAHPGPDSPGLLWAVEGLLCPPLLGADGEILAISGKVGRYQVSVITPDRRLLWRTHLSPTQSPSAIPVLDDAGRLALSVMVEGDKPGEESYWTETLRFAPNGRLADVLYRTAPRQMPLSVTMDPPGALALSQDILYVPQSGVAAVSTSKKRLVWACPQGAQENSCPPVVADTGEVFFASGRIHSPDPFQSAKFIGGLTAVSPSGRELWRRRGQCPRAMAWCRAPSGEGRLIICEDTHCLALSAVSKTVWDFDAKSRCRHLALAPSGDVVVDAEEALIVLSPEGIPRFAAASQGAVRGACPIVDSLGRIYIAGHDRLLAISPEGKLLWRWTPRHAPDVDYYPEPVAIGPAGILYVAIHAHPEPQRPLLCALGPRPNARDSSRTADPHSASTTQ